ncbi:MAG: histidine phosphatase family protein [Eubacteriales bacterium]|nr:histidine phosphatase family protein [Eubacteriales bacterium]
MKLYLLRHGETAVNKKGGIFQGQIEVPLNDAGIAQAQAAHDDFVRRGILFDKVYSSPQGRALHTAQLASGWDRSRILTDDRLKEQSFGPLEGKTWDCMEPSKFHALMCDAGNYVPPAGAESILHLVQRCSSFLEEMRRTRPADTILTVCHGGTIRAMLVTLHALDLDTFWQPPVGNCAWYELTLEDGRFSITNHSRGSELPMGDVPEKVADLMEQA